SVVTLPNSQLISTSVDNLGARLYRRSRCFLGVTYDTHPDLIEAFCEGIRELIRNNPKIRQDFYHVHFNQFGPASLDILLNVFFRVSDFTEEMAEREIFFLEILRLAQKLGVEFAFPTQTLHVYSQQEQPRSPDLGSDLTDRARTIAQNLRLKKLQQTR
ncbi:MAG: mechanosensitive ion channel, partial [Bdellovibrionales bacterium]|nr:mechanosensitive ion channel [Bdellovibrionales bacterium]